MRLRVLTPTRGHSPWLTESMASIASAAPGAEFQLICGEACATALTRNFSSARIVVEKSTGLYAALNQGWREPGEWDALTWLNDDDLLLAPGFGDGLEILAQQPGTDIVYGRVRLIGARGENLGAHPVARCGGDLAALLARGIMPFAQPGTVIRRSLMERLGGFDETYRLAGDLDFFVRALIGGARFAFVNAWSAAFRLHAGQLSKQRAEREAETLRALRPLAGQTGSAAAVWRFRLGNASAYCDRVRRHGFVPMHKLYDRVD